MKAVDDLIGNGIHDIRNDDNTRQQRQNGIDKFDRIVLGRRPERNLALLKKDQVVSSFSHRQEIGQQKYHDHQPLRNGHPCQPASRHRSNQETRGHNQGVDNGYVF